MDIIAFAGCAVVACVLILVVRQQKPELGALVSIGAGAVMLAAAVSRLMPVIGRLEELLSGTGAGDYLPFVLKALGICLVTQLAADICRDAGQQTIASNVELVGRVAIFAAAMPLLGSLLTLAVEIIEG